ARELKQSEAELQRLQRSVADADSMISGAVAAGLVRPASLELQFRLVPRNEALPQTYGFYTRDGSMGVLQILGLESNRLHIRYKLLAYGRAEAAQPRSVFLPNLRIRLRLLDLASAELVPVPWSEGDEIDLHAFAGMERGDLAFEGGAEQGVIGFLRGCTADLRLKRDVLPNFEFTYESAPFSFEVTTPEGSTFHVTVKRASNLGCELEYRRIGADNVTQAEEIPRLPAPVMGYIVGKHMGTWGLAQQKGQPVNTHIYGVDEGFNLFFGGLLTYRNASGELQPGPIRLGNFGPERHDFWLVDETGRPQDYEMRLRPQARLGKYALWWKPDRPVAPHSLRLLGYLRKDRIALPQLERGARLVMSNTFGSHVLENFFLVAPQGMRIAAASPPADSKHTIGGLDIYLWQKQVPANTKHQVDVTLSIGAASEPSPGPQEAQAMMGIMKSLFVSLSEAAERGDAQSGLDVLSVFLPRLDAFHHSLQGTRAHQPVGAAIGQIRLVQEALRDGNIEQAKVLLRAFDHSGPQLEKLVEDAAEGQAPQRLEPVSPGAPAQDR
ncbi:MAG: hypothetical protein KAX44_08415, partial [Candidatus Brocadiae bacterium]|nr:hypothetical protein [Candidatus Brocadiia bacterium]